MLSAREVALLVEFREQCLLPCDGEAEGVEAALGPDPLVTGCRARGLLDPIKVFPATIGRDAECSPPSNVKEFNIFRSGLENSRHWLLATMVATRSYLALWSGRCRPGLLKMT